MSDLNTIANRLPESINEAEQLSLLLLMLMDQKLDEQQLREHLSPLLLKLNADIQDVSMYYGFMVAQGGMGSPHDKRSIPSPC